MARAIEFPPFRLDLDACELRRGAERIRLRPKTLEMLRYLAERPGSTVSKRELMAALWPETHVDDAAVKVCVGELRRALDDDPRSPMILETVRGRGYRFLPEVEGAASGHAARMPPYFVGREAELLDLREAMADARRGRRRMVFVCGDAGIGKTTFVEAFLAETLRITADRERIACGVGRCAHRPGAGDAFQPIIDALYEACQGPDEARLRSLLRDVAPSWLLRIPGALAPSERDVLRRTVVGATRAGTIRELEAALERLSEIRPLILVLEDLHWADEATHDALAAIARATDRACLLVIGTCRPSESLASDTPIAMLIHELTRHRLAREVTLGPFETGEIRAFLERRFGEPADERLATSLGEHTGGNALFLASVVEHLAASGAFADREARAGADASVAEMLRRVPETLRQLVGQELERLPLREQAVLDAAAVAGPRFAAPALTAALEETLDSIESILTTMSRVRSLIRPCGVARWLDGTEAASYEFVHALHRDVIYDRLTPARRCALHEQIGLRLEAAQPSDAGERAAELALHFDRAGDHAKAVVYHEQAAALAVERQAHGAAVFHLERALELLPSSRSPERDLGELRLRTALGPMLMNARGFASPEVERNYARAFDLCRVAGETPDLFPVLEGLQSHSSMNGSLTAAHELSRRMLSLAERSGDPAMRLEAHHAIGTDLMKLARLDEAMDHFHLALGLYDDEVAELAFRWCGHDARVCCQSYLGLCLFHGGSPDAGLAACEAALAHARRLRQPASLAQALFMLAWLRLQRVEADPASRHLRELSALSDGEELPYWKAMARFFAGWALGLEGRLDDAVAAVDEGRALSRPLGPRAGAIEYRMIAAGLYARRGEIGRGLALLDEAAAVHAESGEIYLHGDILALKGTLMLASGDADAAIASLVDALDFARAHGLHPLELRAALTLSRPWEAAGERERARAALARAYRWFSDGNGLIEVRLAETRLLELAS